jgi:hypothetical protein
LAHNVKKTQFLYQLGLIRNAINPLQTANEVVLIYYQGSEWVDQGKSYLRLRTGRGRNQSDVIALEELAGLFTGTGVAHLFLLDVTRYRNPARIPLPSGDGEIAGLLREKLRTHPDVRLAPPLPTP